MADGEENLFLDNLDEFINDQDKIVTYKWLSRTLSVTSNTAKQMLYAFLSKEREEKRNSLSATYLVGGRCRNNEQLVHQYILTSDDNLEETKKQFELVTSVHIYSLQKKTPKDINTLYTVDYEIQQEHKEESNKWSNIYCKEAEKLSDGGASRGCSKTKPGKENAEPKSSEMKNGLDTSKSKPSNQRSKKGQLPSLGMFAIKTEKKPDETKVNESTSNADSDKKEKPSKQAEKSKPSGMMSFFGKQISAKSIPEPKGEKPKEEKPKEEKPKEKSKDEKPKEEKPKEKSKEKKPVVTKDTKKTPENKQKSSKPSKQIRKRIKNFSSSDEEEDPVPKSLKILVSDSEPEEDIKPRRSKGKNKQEKGKEAEKNREIKKETAKKDKEATKDEAKDKKAKTSRKRKKEEKEESSEEDSLKSKTDSTTIGETPISNHKPATKRRKRQKVMRSKTYVDDDGFMVTEKVYESESTDASDEEEIIEVKQDTLPSPVTAKNSSPDSKPKKQLDMKPVKQASLMSFFKKN